MRHALRPFAFAAFLSVAGCGTIYNLSEGPQIYGGVQVDAKHLETTGPCSSWLIGCLDMPFSLILDTAFLPLTIIYELAASEPPPSPGAKER